MQLMHAVSCNCAHYAIDSWFSHLPPEEKAEMWQRFYDSAYAALMTFDEESSASRFRASGAISEN